MTAYYQLLRRDLTGSLPAPQWPAGTVLDHYRDALAPAIHAVLRMTQDQGGGRVANLQTWQHRFITDAEFDPALCLVALAFVVGGRPLLAARGRSRYDSGRASSGRRSGPRVKLPGSGRHHT